MRSRLSFLVAMLLLALTAWVLPPMVASAGFSGRHVTDPLRINTIRPPSGTFGIDSNGDGTTDHRFGTNYELGGAITESGAGSLEIQHNGAGATDTINLSINGNIYAQADEANDRVNLPRGVNTPDAEVGGTSTGLPITNLEAKVFSIDYDAPPAGDCSTQVNSTWTGATTSMGCIAMPPGGMGNLHYVECRVGAADTIASRVCVNDGANAGTDFAAQSIIFLLVGGG